MRYARFLSTIALSGALASVGSAAFAGNPPSTAPASDDNGAAAASDDLSLSGALHESDPVDAEGHHFRTRTVRLHAGETVEVAASSSEIDTVLRVTGPSLSLTNDDAPGEGTNSRLRFTAPANGAYSIMVSSYQPGETGEYQLSVQRGVAQDGSDDSAPSTAQQPSDDGAAQGGVQVPTWTFDPSRGVFVQGGSAPSDDTASAQPDQDPADAGETGDDATADPAAPDTNAGTGTVYGVFVAVSDYQGQNNSLDDTTADARNLEGAFERSGLIRHGNGIVLTDGRANEASVQQAFEALGRRVTPRDTFVFFFDGHGNSNEVELQSGGLSADELSSMLDRIHGRQMLVLDSCESGGFASIVQGHPNRVGMFSSTASESSYVASEVHAGGWLAYYMIQAVRNGLHGSNDSVRLSDLTAYVQRGYNERVHDQQHLVVASGAGRQAVLWHTAQRSNAFAMNP